MGKIGKILLSFLLMLMVVAGAGFLEGEPQMSTDGQTPQNSDLTEVQDAQVTSGVVSRAFGGDSDADPLANAEDYEVMNGKAYASFSPHADMVSKMAPGSGKNGDWGLAFEQRRDRWHENDAVFYGDDRQAVLEPGAMGVLGFGLIGLFFMVRLRLRK